VPEREPVRFSPEVAESLRVGGPVVALESSVLAQGLPEPENREAAELMLAAVAMAGAIPAITAVVQGEPSAGLTTEELDRFLARDGIPKVSTRDLASVMIRRGDGATTVAAAISIARLAGIRVFATGGIGGVHRWPPFDESADLAELARTPMIVVCAGAKSILDLPATMERLESLGVAVIGYGTRELPGFFTAETGIELPAQADSPEEIAALYLAERKLGRPGALLVMNPPPASARLSGAEVEAAVTRATEVVSAEGIRGSAATPRLLDEVKGATGGRSLRANIALLESNASLAARIAVALSADSAAAGVPSRGRRAS
jgi:pseudouridylate synthase